MPETNRLLRVFLCHSSNDKPAVRELYQRLNAESWMDVWLDEEKLFPGQDWDLEIEKAVEATDVVIVCLSSNSVGNEGYVQRELRFVLRIADFKPEGAIFVVPVRMDDCPMPRRLSMWQYLDYFPGNRKEWAYKRLIGSLMLRADKLGVPAKEKTPHKKGEATGREKRKREQNNFVEKNHSGIGFFEKTKAKKKNLPYSQAKSPQGPQIIERNKKSCSYCSGVGYLGSGAYEVVCIICGGRGYVYDNYSA